MGTNEDFFDFLRSISRGKKFGELYLRQLIDVSYESVFDRTPTVQDLQTLYSVRNSPQHEGEWRRFVESMQHWDLISPNPSIFFERFVIPASKELFPSFFRKTVKPKDLSFAIREFINENGPPHLRRPLPAQPRDGMKSNESRPLDGEALDYVNQMHKTDSFKFAKFMDELVFFITSRRGPGSIGTAGSFWDHF